MNLRLNPRKICFCFYPRKVGYDFDPRKIFTIFKLAKKNLLTWSSQNFWYLILASQTKLAKEINFSKLAKKRFLQFWSSQTLGKILSSQNLSSEKNLSSQNYFMLAKTDFEYQCSQNFPQKLSSQNLSFMLANFQLKKLFILANFEFWCSQQIFCKNDARKIFCKNDARKFSIKLMLANFL